MYYMLLEHVWGHADAISRSYSLGAVVCPVPALEKKFKSQKTLGDTDILTVYESGPIGFSLVTAHKKDADNLGRVQSIVAITTATTLPVEGRLYELYVLTVKKRRWESILRMSLNS